MVIVRLFKTLLLAIKGIEIVGYFDDKYDNSYFQQGIYYGPILSAKKLLDCFEEIKFIIAIGNNTVRKMIVEKLNLFDHNYAVLIHPSAIISTKC